MDSNDKFFRWIRVYSGIICSGILVGIIAAHQNSSEHLRCKELESKCNYITPDSGEDIGYKMENGSVVTVNHLDGGLFRRDHLEIKLGNVSFRSKGISPKDARVLEEIFIKNGEKQESFGRENINDYNSWQAEYEKLIDIVAERRLKFEANVLDKVKYH